MFAYGQREQNGQREQKHIRRVINFVSLKLLLNLLQTLPLIKKKKDMRPNDKTS
jgi:hypothetical protein